MDIRQNRQNFPKKETRKSKKIKPQASITVEEWKNMNLRRVTEAEVQAEIITWLAGMGLVAFVIPNRGMYDPRTNRYNRVDQHHIAGIPDVAVVLPQGRVAWLEIKRPVGGIVSPAQHSILSLLTQMGHPACVVRSVVEVETFMRSRGLI